MNPRCRNIRLLKFGIESNENDFGGSFDIVEETIARAFAFASVAVWNAHFKNCKSSPRNLIAKTLSRCQTINDRLNIRANMTILFGEPPQVTFEFRRVLNLNLFA